MLFKFLRPKTDLGVWLFNARLDQSFKVIRCGIVIFTPQLNAPIRVYSPEGDFVAKVLIPDFIKGSSQTFVYSDVNDDLEIDLYEDAPN